jgi:formylglycine-generating enzyme required for sulfatase activity
VTPSRAHAEEELALDLGGAEPKTVEASPAGRRLELRHVAAGKLVQGSPPTEVGRDPDESVRNVTFTHAFWMGKTPVTRAQFARFVTETRHVTDAEKGQAGGMGWDPKTSSLVLKKEFTWRNPGFTQKDDDPVVLVTYGDANAFTAWASRKTGRRVRLPTEAEWEYAARAGTTTPWYGAAKEEDALATGWFRPNGSFTTHPVGQKKPNAWGLFDMTGNVQQWVRDVYAPYPAGDTMDPENTTNPSTEPERRVMRGGSWLRDPKRGRSSARSKNSPGTRHADIGFRVAVDEDVVQQPGLGSVPMDFAPASPIGIASNTPTLAQGADASAARAAVVMPTPTRSSSEGFPWPLIAAPFASAGVVIAWVLARRGARMRPAPERIGKELPPPPTRPVPPRDAVIEAFVGPPSTHLTASSSILSARSQSPRSGQSPPSLPMGPPTPLQATSVTGSAQTAPPRNAIVDRRESQSPFRASPPAPSSDSGGEGELKSANVRAAELDAFDAWMASAKAEAAKASEQRLATAKAFGPKLGPTKPEGPRDRDREQSKVPEQPRSRGDLFGNPGSSGKRVETDPGSSSTSVGRPDSAAELSDAEIEEVDEAKAAPKPADSKPSAPRPPESKPSISKPTEPSQPKPAVDSKPSVPRPADSKPSEPKAVEPRPADADETQKIDEAKKDD